MRKLRPLDGKEKMLIYVAIASNGSRGVDKSHRELIKPIEKKLGIEIKKREDGTKAVIAVNDKKGVELLENELSLITNCINSPRYKYTTSDEFDDAMELIEEFNALEFIKEADPKPK